MNEQSLERNELDRLHGAQTALSIACMTLFELLRDEPALKQRFNMRVEALRTIMLNSLRSDRASDGFEQEVAKLNLALSPKHRD